MVVSVKMTEAYIEKKVCEYAKFKGWINYKFTSPSNRGVPDRIFLKSGTVVFVEFKAKGKKPTKLQEKTLLAIRSAGFLCYVFDDIGLGKRTLDAIIHA